VKKEGERRRRNDWDRTWWTAHSGYFTTPFQPLPTVVTVGVERGKNCRDEFGEKETLKKKRERETTRVNFEEFKD